MILIDIWLLQLGASYATIPRLGRRTVRNFYQHNYPYPWIGARVVYDCWSISSYYRSQWGLHFPIVWISIFLFFLLALSLRKFTGSHCIVPMHVYIYLLENTRSRSSRKIVAGVFSQWFWCKYFAHSFILHSKSSKKKYRQHTLHLKTVIYLLYFARVVSVRLEEKNTFCLICHTASQLDSFSAQPSQRQYVVWCVEQNGTMHYWNWSR